MGLRRAFCRHGPHWGLCTAQKNHTWSLSTALLFGTYFINHYPSPSSIVWLRRFGQGFILQSIPHFLCASLQTRFCPQLEKPGSCAYGVSCKLAHSKDQLNQPISCQASDAAGFCSDGHACPFAEEQEQLLGLQEGELERLQAAKGCGPQQQPSPTQPTPGIYLQEAVSSAGAIAKEAGEGHRRHSSASGVSEAGLAAFGEDEDPALSMRPHDALQSKLAILAKPIRQVACQDGIDPASLQSAPVTCVVLMDVAAGGGSGDDGAGDYLPPIVGYAEDGGEEPLTMPQFPRREGAQLCIHYSKTGHCRFGNECCYDHPVEQYAVPRTELGLPYRKGQPVCAFYLKKNACKFGPACKFHHPKLQPVYAGLALQGAI